MAWDGDVPAERRRSTRAAVSSSRTADVEAVAVRTYAYEGFEPVAVLDGLDDAAIIECDQVGQPRLAVDRAGALVWEGRFDPWGGDLEVGGDGDLEIDARLPGQVADSESGLRYNRHRYYDPKTKSYNRSDPAGLRGGLRVHNYVHHPLGWVDLFGLGGCNIKKRLHLGEAGHHVPAVRKARGRPFEIGRSDKTRPTFHFRGNDPGHDHWRLHDAERTSIGPRQGDFPGADDELFDAYRTAYSGLDDIRIDVRSPNGTHTLGTDVSPREGVDLIDNWLRANGQR